MRHEKNFRRDIAEFIANPAFHSVAHEYGLEDDSFLLLGIAPPQNSALYFIDGRPVLGGVSASFKCYENDYFYTSQRALQRVTRLAGFSRPYVDDLYLRRLLGAQVYYVREENCRYKTELFLDFDEWLDGNIFLRAVDRLAEEKDCLVITRKPELWHVKIDGARGPWGKGLWVWRAIWAQRSDGSAFSVLCAVESGDVRIVPNLAVIPLEEGPYHLEASDFLTTRLMRLVINHEAGNRLERYT